MLALTTTAIALSGLKNIREWEDEHREFQLSYEKRSRELAQKRSKYESQIGYEEKSLPGKQSKLDAVKRAVAADEARLEKLTKAEKELRAAQAELVNEIEEINRQIADVDSEVRLTWRL